MSFQLKLYENEKDEYYYGGHITVNSQLFSMDRDILIDNLNSAAL